MPTVTLTPEQREVLETLGDFTEDTFWQPQYAGLLLNRLRKLAKPLSVDDAARWAREREWSEHHVGMLAGIAWTVRFGFDPRYGEPLAFSPGRGDADVL